MDKEALLFEELSLNLHPALQTQLYDGWVLLFANGYTRRANSVCPLYPSALGLQEKIAECESRYSSLGLPASFKLLESTGLGLDEALEQRGYRYDMPTDVMAMDLRGKAFPFGGCETTGGVDDAWLDAYFAFSNYTEDSAKATATQILANVRSPMVCGRIVKGGTSVACGIGVIERGFMGLNKIVVDERERGKGFGREICESLLAAGISVGAHTAYLQVAQENQGAVSLYTKLGFSRKYTYWYRIKDK